MDAHSRLYMRVLCVRGVFLHAAVIVVVLAPV